MLISTNPDPSIEKFDKLLNQTTKELSKESKAKEKEYLGLLGTKLEKKVFDIMNSNAKDTAFENSIELISGQKFPDIIAKNYFGVEVKTTKQNHWKTTGNSVLESTRVEGIEKIFMLFGKIINPIEFRYRPYEDCLSEVVVTHSPRYLIDMELKKGDTIFDKINMSYNILRQNENPIKPIIKYYKSILNEGEEVWWIDKDKEMSKSLIIRFWNSLSPETKKSYKAKGMAFFPEIFDSNFNHFSLWLYENESIICPNVRDLFTSGGKGKIEWENTKYSNIPRVLINFDNYSDKIKGIIQNTPASDLERHWNKHNFTDKRIQWIKIVSDYTADINSSLDLKAYLKSKLFD